MTFHIDDRVKLLDDYMDDYEEGAICTVKAVSNLNGTVGILSDTDPDQSCYLYVPARDIVHVTNVPTVRPAAPTGSRAFSTGATRDTDEGKLDFEGFLSPLVLKRYAEHMHDARKMPDGTLRASDNWQLGIPKDVYMKSMWRHFFDVWDNHRNPKPSRHQLEAELCGLLFNVSGMLHEILKAKKND